MTDADETVEAVIDEAEKKPATGYYYAEIKGRRVLIKDINEAQSMVLGGFLRQIGGTVDFDQVMAIFGKLMLLLDNLIVDKADMAWLEERILVGEIAIEDFAAVFHSHTTETKPVAAKKPRRGK